MMGGMRPTHVSALHTFPVTGEPGLDHDGVVVEADGLAGDRRKKAAVSLVGNDSPSTRSNVVLDIPSAEVETLVGSVVRIGDVLLAVERPAGSCPGVYAAVGEVGVIRIGDPVLVQEASEVHPADG